MIVMLDTVVVAANGTAACDGGILGMTYPQERHIRISRRAALFAAWSNTGGGECIEEQSLLRDRLGNCWQRD